MVEHYENIGFVEQVQLQFGSCVVGVDMAKVSDLDNLASEESQELKDGHSSEAHAAGSKYSPAKEIEHWNPDSRDVIVQLYTRVGVLKFDLIILVLEFVVVDS